MDEKYFNQQDLKNLLPGEETKFEVEFKPEPTPKKEQPTIFWKVIAKFTGLFLLIFLITFVLINFSALSKNFHYLWEVQITGGTYKKTLPTPTPVASFDPTAPAKIVIPKIGTQAPISWNVAEDQIPAKLLEGVVHSQGTALPGEPGNVFITGHSSYYSWSSSPYKDVFALLEKLAPGDQIYIESQGKTFTYEVKETKVVSPEDVSVMEKTANNQLTLMTCVPIGTNLKRLIIIGLQVSP